MYDFTGEYADVGCNTKTDNTITGLFSLFQTGDSLRGFYCVWRAWDGGEPISFSSPTRSGLVTGRVIDDCTIELNIAGNAQPLTLTRGESGDLGPFLALKNQRYINDDSGVKRLGILQYLLENEESASEAARIRPALDELTERVRTIAPYAFESWMMRQEWICKGLPVTPAREAMMVAWAAVKAGQGTYVPVPCGTQIGLVRRVRPGDLVVHRGTDMKVISAPPAATAG